MNNPLIKQVVEEVKKEMLTYKESMDYMIIEVFVGCVIARLRANQLVTTWEAEYIRKELL